MADKGGFLGDTVGGKINFKDAALKAAIENRQNLTPPAPAQDYKFQDVYKAGSTSGYDKAQEAKARYMKENNLDENGNPLPKPSTVPGR